MVCYRFFLFVVLWLFAFAVVCCILVADDFSCCCLFFVCLLACLLACLFVCLFVCLSVCCSFFICLLFVVVCWLFVVCCLSFVVCLFVGDSLLISVFGGATKRPDRFDNIAFEGLQKFPTRHDEVSRT